MTVMGRYLMKPPTIPGQNKSGKNTIRVVTVDAIIGQAILTEPSL
jgi:hypothetical protein